MATRPPQANSFLNGTNYQKIVGFLRQHYASKLGGAVPERFEARLQRSVQHYMQEVSRVQAGKPLNMMSQEVVRTTTESMDAWLKKEFSNAPSAITTVGTPSRPALPTKVPVAAVMGGALGGVAGSADTYDRLFEDTSTSYERLMAERAPPAAVLPAMPDFRIGGGGGGGDGDSALLESNEDPVVLMQRLQKARDEQARAMGLPVSNAAALSAPSATAGAAAPFNTVVTGPRLRVADEDAPPSAARPSPPQADLPPPQLAPRPQDYIIPQEDVVKYKETEYNIFITSSDRDWLRNTSENRYNFTVNFNTGSKRQGFGYSPAIQERFRNIQRIEFVKAIVPIEPLTSLVRVAAASPAVVYDTARVVNVFSLPFANVRIAELNGMNGFSTKPEEDNTNAIVQYDTTWSSDLLSQASASATPLPVLTKSGYTGMIPKFLKAQRVYSPTPLGSLQRMSIRMENHAGETLSADSDVLGISRICMSGDFTSIGTNSTVYAIDSANIENSYIFVKTNAYFPYSAVSEGDRIVVAGYAPATTSDAATDFQTFINRAEGHYVVAVGYVNAAGALVDGRNEAGYCNVIVLRSRFDNPATGSTQRTAAYFGGSLAAENVLAAALDNPTVEPALSGCALLNSSRQTHFVLRIITRDMDSGANLRPDNV
jgi:hypothetical protein